MIRVKISLQVFIQPDINKVAVRGRWNSKIAGSEQEIPLDFCINSILFLDYK